MIRLHLYGQLATDYGEYMDISAKTPREAVTALAYQCPKYKDHLINHNWHIVLGKQENDIKEQELDLNLGNYQEVHLIPEIMGQGKWGTTIVGAVLFVVGAVITYGSWGAASGVGVKMMWMGGAMMLGGLIAATTSVPGVGDTRVEEEDKRASFLFSGAVNTSTQGLPIPRGYGRLLIGSAVVSASVYAEEIPEEDEEEVGP